MRDLPQDQGNSSDRRTGPAPSGAAIVPELELPKGGGALASIDESLTVNAVTGTASLSLPLPLSPGRDGFGPKLALQHDSGLGNSPFALGWGCAPPSIARRSRARIPRFIDDGPDADPIELSGAEELVPALRLQGGSWVPIETPRNEDGVAYTAKRYRPRVESGFARVERWRRDDTGDIHWRSTDASNVTTVFGQSLAARLADPGDPKRVAVWHAERSYDARGNLIVYDYVAEDMTGIPDSLAERPRLSGRAQVAQTYLKRIRYGAKTPYTPGGVVPDMLFEAVFDYGDHAGLTPTPVPDQPWPMRSDPFSRHRMGFEQRTYRLCRRVLMFHRFAELGPLPCLVRALELTHSDTTGVNLLSSVTERGYIRDAGGVYTTKETPPLTLRYAAHLFDGAVRQVARGDVGPVPAPAAGARVQWADMLRSGLPGLVTETSAGISFRENLGQGRLAADRPLVSQPTGAELATGQLALADPEADTALTFALNASARRQGGWQVTAKEGIGAARFAPLRQVADTGAPKSVRRLDLTGDGRPDLLITENDRLVWYETLPGGAEGPGGQVARALDEDNGPAVVFSSADEVVLLANMTGQDQLRDIVRVRQGEVCYWPNQGYGQFGAKVTMHDAPQFDHPDSFDPNRLRLSDLNGTGPADLVYLGRKSIRIWLNRSGNGFASGRDLPAPLPDETGALALVDLLGKGTSCLVWTSEDPARASAPLAYIDLMAGQVPNRLTGYDNGMGLEVSVEYRASTDFWREDRDAGRPWATTLPFPVQCVSRVETRDHIAGTVFSTSYRYAHGYYDPGSREFRGFGRVDQMDQDRVTAYDTMPAGALAPRATPADLTQAPVETRSWYDLGISVGRDDVMATYRREFLATPLPEPAPIAPEPGLKTADWRDAYRACRSRPIRREIYGQDGAPNADTPYSVAMSVCRAVQVQPSAGNAPAVFRVEASEDVTHHLDRDPTQRRTEQTLTLASNGFGQPLQVAKISYPRLSPDPTAPAPVQTAQAQMRIGLTETDYTMPLDTPAGHRLPTACETRSYEITGLAVPASLLTRDTLATHLAAATDINHEDTPTAGPQRRLLTRNRSLFLADDLSAALPFGLQGLLGLGFEDYAQVLTPGLLTALFGARVSTADLTAAGYVTVPGQSGWWAPSGQQEYAATAAQHFYRPSAMRNGFGHKTQIVWDAYDLMVRETIAPAPILNREQAVNDYRVLGPVMLTDANGNRSAVRLDELEMVVASAVMGKPGAGEGDTLDAPTVALSYDLFAWINHGRPTWARSRSRTRHGVAGAPLQEIVSHYDGAGDVIMYKGQAEPGLAPTEGPGGTITMVDTGAAPRWIGNGRVIRTNKGQPVLQYEPYFSATDAYESHPALVQMGVSPIYRYDAIGRRTETLNPDGTLVRAVHGAWTHAEYDANDTVLDSPWYATLGSPAPGGPEPADPAARAAWLAAHHANTPKLTYLNPQGEEIGVEGDNGAQGKAFAYEELDITGEPLRSVDPRGLIASEYHRDMAGNIARQRMLDSSEKVQLSDVTGKPLLEWDEKGQRYEHRYDALRRLTQTWLTRPGQAAALVTEHVYGETRPNPEAANLRGNKVATYDQAGLAEKLAYDFKYNVLDSRQTYAANYKTLIDWNTGNRAALLEGEAWRSGADFDALDRATEIRAPARPGDPVIRILPVFTVSNLLDSVQVARGAEAPRSYVTHIDYDAKGQRTAIRYGNGVETTYTYDHKTYRLTRMLSTRSSDGRVLQDLRYWRDPVGNITDVQDHAQQTSFFNNAVVAPHMRYAYDALYQLTDAWGREHIGQNRVADAWDDTRGGLVLPGDATAMRSYHQHYDHDPAGNLIRMIHAAGSGAMAQNWTRDYDIDPASNRLTATRIGAAVEAYGHGPQGAMVLPHLDAMDWSEFDRLRSVRRGTSTTFYVYDYKGERVRKVTEKGAGVVEDRRYMGDYELFRRSGPGGVQDISERLHVSDDSTRIASVDLVLREGGGDLASPRRLDRYQQSNHIGSTSAELDHTGAVISYEEYHPFGTTAFQAGRSLSEVKDKTYRFAGAERDEESGLYHMGARYLAPWLGRWTAPDPAGHEGSGNAYAYTENNPVNASDPTGLWSWRTVAVVAAAVVVGTVVTVATAGAAGPIVGTAAAAIIGGGVGGAAAGVTAELTDAGLSGRPIEGGRVARAAGGGLVVGAAIATGGVAIGAVATGGGGAAGALLRSGASRVATSAPGRVVASAGRAVAGSRPAVAARSAASATAGRALGAVHRGSVAAGERAAARIPGSAMRRAIARGEHFGSTPAGQAAAARARARMERANVQGDRGAARQVRTARPDEQFSHDVNWRAGSAPPSLIPEGRNAAAIAQQGGFRVGTRLADNQWGPGVYVYPGPVQPGAAPRVLQFTPAPRTAVELIRPSGSGMIGRLVPPPGFSHVPVTITQSTAPQGLVSQAGFLVDDLTMILPIYPLAPLSAPALSIGIGSSAAGAASAPDAPPQPANQTDPPIPAVPTLQLRLNY